MAFSDLPILYSFLSPRREVVVAMLKPHTDFGWHVSCNDMAIMDEIHRNPMRREHSSMERAKDSVGSGGVGVGGGRGGGGDINEGVETKRPDLTIVFDSDQLNSRTRSICIENEDSQVAGDIELSELRVDSESETAPPRTGRIAMPIARTWSGNPVDHLTKKDFKNLGLTNVEQEEPPNYEEGVGSVDQMGNDAETGKAGTTVDGDLLERPEREYEEAGGGTVDDGGEDKTTEEDGGEEGAAASTSAGLRRDEVYLTAEL